MENMKMSEVWNKPLTFSVYDSVTVSGFTISNGFGVLFSNEEPAKAVCHAVNNHDRLVEENAELRESIKFLTSEDELRDLDENAKHWDVIDKILNK